MVFKDILVYVDAGKTTAGCLDVATKLAAAHDAHVTALHVTPPPFAMGDFGPGGMAEVMPYGHSRLRELTLGGVTRHLLQHMIVPVLMSH